MVMQGIYLQSEALTLDRSISGPTVTTQTAWSSYKNITQIWEAYHKHILTPFYCRGHERVELYLYSPYGPYGLYRASVPVQGCSLALPFYHKHIKGVYIYCVMSVRKMLYCTLPWAYVIYCISILIFEGLKIEK